MRVCSLPKCRQNGLTLFKIQGSYRARENWKSFCKENGNSTSQSFLLCENHFDQADIIREYGKCRLRPDSVAIYRNLEEHKVIGCNFNILCAYIMVLLMKIVFHRSLNWKMTIKNFK